MNIRPGYVPMYRKSKWQKEKERRSKTTWIIIIVAILLFFLFWWNWIDAERDVKAACKWADEVAQKGGHI